MKSNQNKFWVVVVVLIVLAVLWYVFAQRPVGEEAMEKATSEINNTVKTSVTVIAPDEQ